MPLRLNVLADDQFRADLMELVRDNIRPVVYETIKQECLEHFEKYIAAHELSSLVPDAVKRAMPEISKNMNPALQDAVKAAVTVEVQRYFTDAYMARLAPQLKDIVVRAMREAIK